MLHFLSSNQHFSRPSLSLPNGHEHCHQVARDGVYAWAQQHGFHSAAGMVIESPILQLFLGDLLARSLCPGPTVICWAGLKALFPEKAVYLPADTTHIPFYWKLRFLPRLSVPEFISQTDE